MATRLLHLHSIDQLRAHAQAWDDLWARSAVTIPTAQAALLEQWLHHFDQTSRFQAVVVEHEGRFLAALPLASSRLRGMLTAATMPSNHWTPASDLLVDPAAGPEVYDLLAQGLATPAWSLLWLDFAITDAPRWQALVAACKRQGQSADLHPHFRLPRVDIDGTWEAYRATWSRNHRQNMSRARRKLEHDHGPITLRQFVPTDSHEMQSLLRCGFAIEDRCWKGAAGSSVLRTPGMFEYFAGQAGLLAQRGQLELAFLDVAESPIAFMYGWRAKEIFHAFKAGYDEAFAAYSPGQLLIHDMLERCFQTGSHRIFDCVGPVTPATRRWQTSDYEAGRVVIAPRRLLGQAAYFAYKHLAPTLRRWRAAPRTAELVHDRENVALAKDE